jgi:transcriptional regulator with XRE-family HTH domain
MFGDIEYALRENLRNDREYAEEYADAFLNSYIATQIKVIREQREMTQAELGERIGTTQTGISRIEDVNYSSWSIRTLRNLARAFGVRLRVSFDSYGTLPDEVVRFDRERLQVVKREEDPALRPRRNIQTDSNENLLRALDPTRPRVPQRDTTPSQEGGQTIGERNATDIGAARKSLRLLNPRRVDARDRNIPPEPSGVSGGKMPVFEEPQLDARVQLG